MGHEALISDALAMSRLILDNGYSTEYAARIFDYSDGEQQVMPPPIPQPGVCGSEGPGTGSTMTRPTGSES